MPVKSIINVEVNDQQFLNFSELFGKYQKALAAMPTAWKAVNKETRSSFEMVAAALMAHGEMARRAVANEKSFARESAQSATHWQGLARSTKSVAGNISEATRSLLKWTALTSVISGLLGAGGLFGIDRLASSVASGRRSSQGLGLTFGEQRAFGVNFGRVVDPDSYLAAVNQALHSVQGRVALYGAGMTPGEMTGDTAQTGVALLGHLKQIADTTNPAMLSEVMRARHLDEIVSLQDMERLRAMSPQEFAQYRQQYGQDAGRFGVGDTTQKMWQDFYVQMQRAGQEIENVLIKGLVVLEPGLLKLSDAVAKMIEAVGNSPAVKQWMVELSAGLERFATYIDTPQFQQDVSNFIANFGAVADKIVEVAKKLGVWTQNAAPVAIGAGLGAAVGGLPGAAVGAGVGAAFNSYTTQLNKQFQETLKKGYIVDPLSGQMIPMQDEATLDLIRKLEGSGDAAVSSKGAVGRYQITPATAQQYGFDPSRLKDPAYNERVARAIVADLAKRYSGNTAEELVAYNAGPGWADKFRAAGDNPNILPAETQQYLKNATWLTRPQIVVTINNNTGGNVTVQTAQVAQ